MGNVVATYRHGKYGDKTTTNISFEEGEPVFAKKIKERLVESGVEPRGLHLTKWYFE